MKERIDFVAPKSIHTRTQYDIGFELGCVTMHSNIKPNCHKKKSVDS